MKTLVLFGAARQNGQTKALLDAFLNGLEGEVEIIDAYRMNNKIAPCKDCRFCWHKKGCSIKDGMQEIYQKYEEADNVIVASPMYFHSITGELKVLIDRFQVYWAGHVRKDKPETNTKKGAIIMVGGAPSFENQFLGGEIVLTNFLKDLSTDCEGIITFSNTDKDSIKDSEEIKKKAYDLAQKLNR